MSAKTLAEQLDQLRAEQKALLQETERRVTVSNLSAKDASDVADACAALGWPIAIRDAGENEWDAGDIRPQYAPFRIEIEKPAFADGNLLILTNSGFAQSLARGMRTGRWQIARLSRPLATQGMLFAPWDDATPFEAAPPTKNPRALVRESAAQRIVPSDIRPWLLLDESPVDLADQTSYLWANAAAQALIPSLANEIDPTDGSVKFKGPPKLSRARPAANADYIAALGAEGFNALQSAARWVYESEREAEVRHTFLATEIARSTADQADLLTCIREVIADAHEGAKIAYQLSLSDLSRETLRALSDLRKSITEETAKLADTTRQLVTSVAGALTAGIGLTAAKVALTGHHDVIIAIMVVIAVYVLLVTLSGFQFIYLQRQLRSEWQPRLYKFLPMAEYDKMVSAPAKKAEQAFCIAATLGLLATAGLSFFVIQFALQSAPPVSGTASALIPTALTPNTPPPVKPMPPPTPAAPAGPPKQP